MMIKSQFYVMYVFKKMIEVLEPIITDVYE